MRMRIARAAIVGAALGAFGFGCGGGSSGGSAAPAVTATTPAAGATDVREGTVVTATFDTAIDPATLRATTFILEDASGRAVSGTVSSGPNTVSFTAGDPLAFSTLYTVTVTTGVKDVAGHPMSSDYSWSFTTKAPPTAGSWSGARQLGTASDDQATGVTTDGQGGVYLAGRTQGNLDGLVNQGGEDIFLAKYDASGDKVFTKVVGTPRTDAPAVVVDGGGNLYVTGSTAGDLDGNSNADPTGGTSDIFVIKFDAAGEKIFTRQLGTPREDLAAGLAVDGQGNFYVAGSTRGDLDGNLNADASGQTFDLFLVKFDTLGNRLFTRQFGTPGDDLATSVAVDADGNVYVAGVTAAGLDGNVNSDPPGSTDLFVMKFDPAGTKLVTRQRGSVGGKFGELTGQMVVDSAGGVYVAGSTDGSMDGNANLGGRDALLVKFDSALNWLFTKQFGTEKQDAAAAVAVDPGGSVYVTGHTFGGLDGNVNADPAGVTSDLFLLKLDSAGNPLFTKQVGTVESDGGLGLAIDGTGSIFVAGFSNSGLDGETSNGLSDAIVVKFGPDGSQQ